MPNDVQAAISNAPKPEALYEKLEDRILARDQKGASEVYYELARQRRPLNEIIAEAVRIHAPYTHVPYHERIDDGYVNFVNNDHCLLSARATVNLTRLMPEDCAGLPMAQTIWYIPTGLDIWNQKILKAPGHYARAPGWSMPPGPPPTMRPAPSMPARSTWRSGRAGTRPMRWPATSSRSFSKSRPSRRSPMAAPRPRNWRSSPTTRSR